MSSPSDAKRQSLNSRRITKRQNPVAPKTTPKSKIFKLTGILECFDTDTQVTLFHPKPICSVCEHHLCGFFYLFMRMYVFLVHFPES